MRNPVVMDMFYILLCCCTIVLQDVTTVLGELCKGYMDSVCIISYNST